VSTVAFGSDVLVTEGGPLLIEMFTAPTVTRAGFPESVICGLNVTLPDVVGVPVIAPELSSDRPAGKLEFPMLQV
jgi:hypothetical protein